jgi:hypothetical protein
MDPTQWDVLEPQRTALRTLVSKMEQELSSLGGGEANGSRQSLQNAWDALVRALALGPEPELRSCESCKRSIMVTATRCRYCWLKASLPPRTLG